MVLRNTPGRNPQASLRAAWEHTNTVIPEASQGGQAWDRYAGMNNNPVRWNDPSGHDVGCGGKDCEYKMPVSTLPPTIPPTGPSVEYLTYSYTPPTVIRAAPPISPNPLITTPCMVPPDPDYSFVLDRASDATSIIPVAVDGLSAAAPSSPLLAAGGGFSAWAQWERDSDLNLTLGQRLVRSSIVGGEAMAISYVSSGAGIISAGAGTVLAGPITGTGAGFAIGYMATASTLASTIDNTLNSWIFDQWGLNP